MIQDPTAADTQLPAWDETAALSAVAGDADLARELLTALIAGLPAEIEGLRAAAIVAGGSAALAEVAHHMRGATRYCGVLALDAALEDLERAAKAGNTADMAAGLAQVEAEAARLAADCG
ncbi:MAG TPA: Hpt domain-containing protein [Lamprocystis sp. (in: g-proteobacteria)]|nr:Hpt domain-containing protein [Lamprocystis sp. (in: g-proteobacteria)]